MNKKIVSRRGLASLIVIGLFGVMFLMGRLGLPEWTMIVPMGLLGAFSWAIFGLFDNKECPEEVK